MFSSARSRARRDVVPSSHRTSDSVCPDSAGRDGAAPRAHQPRRRGGAARRIRLALLLATRTIRRLRLRLALFSGWVWVAAASLVGFEVLEILLGAFLAAPEALPIVLLVLAAAWYFRRALTRLWRRLTTRGGSH